MTSTCTRLTTRSVSPRVAVAGVVLALALAPSSGAYAAGEAPSTIRALIGGDGSVSEVERLGGEGGEAAASDLPLTMAISRSVDGDTTTTNYEVENTTAATKAVDYLDAGGQPGSAAQDVALPLVAQLAVRLPSSRTDIEASGARITKLADGSTELVWSMVLFSPIGSPQQDVSFSAKGEGEPLARLDAMAVAPNGSPGLAATSQAANATVNGNAILSVVGNGANDGLLKLSDGVGKLLDGLIKLEDGANALNAGLADKAAPGARKLADGGTALARGLKTASDGSKQLSDGLGSAAAGGGKLSDGLGQLSTGAKDLSAGAGALDAGAGKISDGLASADAGGQKLATGGQALSAGAGQAAAGAKALSDGLVLISGGLDQISAAQGLPAALDGAKRLQVGVDQLRAGLGAPATAGTILNGVAQISGGLSQLAAPGGLPAAKAGVDAIKKGIDQEILPGLGAPDVPAQTIRYAVEQVRASLSSGSANGGGIDQLVGLVRFARGGIMPPCGDGPPSPNPMSPCEAANTALFALDHPEKATGPNDPGGLKQQSAAGAGGLGAAGAGLTGIVKGLNNADPNDPDFPGITQGLGAISGGLSTALAGIGALRAGVDGVPNPANGNQIDNGLTFGLNRVAGGLESGDPTKPGIAEGLDSLVAGLTTAVGGVTQLATGASSAKTGAGSLAAGNAALAAGAGEIAKGNTDLSSGLTQLFTGSKDLRAGTGALSAGSVKLSDGAAAASKGSGDLGAGLNLLSAGGKKLSDGLPAAVDGAGQIGAGAGELADGLDDAADGSGQIADGLGKVVEGETAVGQGLTDVREKAVEVLRSQFAQGTTLARQQLAGLEASSAMLTDTPGAASTTWVLTQSTSDIGFETVSSTSGTGDLGRNVGLAAGGALLLMAGVAGGFLSGRRNAVAAAHAAAPTE